MRITYEGEHRCGKGTQIELYKEHHGADIPVVRGDGSYQGGLENVLTGDEIAFRNHLNERLYKEADKGDLLWGIAATACAMTVNNPKFDSVPLLIDRGPISRASFLLSRGKRGRDLIDSMYPSFVYEMDGDVMRQDGIPLDEVDFGRIIYIRAPTSVLLSRISDNDPKADFRRKNIIEKEGLFDRAIGALPLDMRNSVEIVDGNQHPEDVLRDYDS